MKLTRRWSIPGAVQIPVTPAAPPTLHRISLEVVLTTGLLFGGGRKHVLALSTLWWKPSISIEKQTRGEHCSAAREKVKPYPLPTSLTK
jgi:hypothetical protein